MHNAHHSQRWSYWVLSILLMMSCPDELKVNINAYCYGTCPIVLIYSKIKLLGFGVSQMLSALSEGRWLGDYYVKLAPNYAIQIGPQIHECSVKLALNVAKDTNKHNLGF